MKDKPFSGVPIHLRDASYKGAKSFGHGKGYKYPHDYPGHYVPQQYLPENLKDARYYQPSGNGREGPDSGNIRKYPESKNVKVVVKNK